MNQTSIKIKEFFVKNETKIVLFVGFCLISAISFEFGFLQGQKWQQEPLTIESGHDIAFDQSKAIKEITEAQGAYKSSTTTSEVSNSANSNTSKQATNNLNCAFVGSKNSNKFYLSTCSYAKRVKPENMVCFKSAQEALGQGRIESKCK